MAEKLFQKGGNGLVAEYQCAETLHRELSDQGVACAPSRATLSRQVREAIDRVAGDLSKTQRERALNQGNALGEYLAGKLLKEPELLGLPADLSGHRLASATITPTGHLTNKNGSSDIDLRLDYGDRGTLKLPVSLKAYRSSTSSLGSKSARASLARMFFGAPEVSDEDFLRMFGPDARDFIELLEQFKSTAEEFYDHSAEGKAFLDAFEKERGTRKVNNPLRRAQVGDYFEKQHGFTPEHEFARLYANMFNTGFSRVGRFIEWDTFLQGAEFVLGVDDSILTLNAIAGDDGEVTRIVNSFTSDAYGKLRATLVEGCQFRLTPKEQSSIIKVLLTNGKLGFDGLTLAVWKDATIQFKLTS
ncbi:hypothetical protein [Haloferula sp. A504]|uniref:hypothetical protein n=1 Tax=Haloferula sp. A504 TaxID=3373601 RepID=UPI0031C364E5|nr:hypothetical protein [Verrucomicrobiaceae bacterium E54]